MLWRNDLKRSSVGKPSAGDADVGGVDDGEPSHWEFVDVTEASGLGDNNHRFSFSASWDDYDNDGDFRFVCGKRLWSQPSLSK